MDIVGLGWLFEHYGDQANVSHSDPDHGEKYAMNGNIGWSCGGMTITQFQMEKS